eukprot:Hpha_TRINITY_DN2405_c0_g1::TRINITY_DN2405_c0_g1_i1::g.24747::m.24747
MPADNAVFQVSSDRLWFPPPHKGHTEKPVLSNRGDSDAIFKIKTTMPDAFSVKPRMGRLPAGKQLPIQITCRGTEPQWPAKFQTEIRTLSEKERQALEQDGMHESKNARSLVGAPPDTDDLIAWIWKHNPGDPVRMVLQTDFSAVKKEAAPQPSGQPQKSQAEMKKEMDEFRRQIDTFNSQPGMGGAKLSKKPANSVSVPLWMLIFACLVSLAFGVLLHRYAPEVGKQLQEAIVVGQQQYTSLAQELGLEAWQQ